jgi:hypothetical protein
MQIDDAPPPAPPPPKPSAISTPPPKQPLRVELVDDEPAVAVPAPAPLPRPSPPPRPQPQVLDELEEVAEEPVHAAELYEPDEPRSHRREPQSSPWFFVRLALLLVAIGSCVLAAAFAIKLVGYLLLTIELINVVTWSTTGPREAFREPNNTFAILVRIGEVLAVLGSLTAVVGYVFCLLGPKDRGKLGMGITVTAVAGVHLLLSLGINLTFVFGSLGFNWPTTHRLHVFMPESIYLIHRVGWFMWFMLVLNQLLFVAELVLFPLYFRLVARDLRRSGVGRMGVNTLFVTAPYGVLRLLVWVMYFIAQQVWVVSIDSYVASIQLGVFRQVTPPEIPRGLIWVCIVLLWLGSFAYIAQIIWYTIYLWKAWGSVPVDDRR